MVSAKIRSQKIIHVTAKLYSSRKPSRSAYRKKLNRLTHYRHRELFHAKHDKISALLSTSRPYLRTSTNRASLRKQHCPSKKSAHRNHSQLSAARAEKLTKARIISALSRRKRYHYKKLTYQLLKTRRLQWLRAAQSAKRKKTLRLGGLSKNTVRALTPFCMAQTALIRSSLRRKITLLLRARRPDHSNRSVRQRLKSLKSRRLKRRPLKLRRPRGRYLKLQLRRKLHRRSHKLRQRVSKRSSHRSRREVLVAASWPARQYLYYRRLARTQRAGVSIQRLRALRLTLPSSTAVRALSRRNRIEQSWHSEMVRTTCARRTTTTQKRVLKRQKVGKSTLPTTTKAAISTVKTKLPKSITAEDIRTLLRKSGGCKFSSKYQRRTSIPPFLKSTFIGLLKARQRSRKSRAGHSTDQQTTSKKIKHVKGRPAAPLRRWFVRPLLQANLQVKPSASATLKGCLSAIQSLLRSSANQLNHLKQIKHRKVTARKARRNRRGTIRLTKAVNRLKREQSWLKGSFKRTQPVTVPRRIATTELRRTLIADTTSTPSGRRPLIRRYLDVGRLSRVHLCDFRPRVDHAAASRLPRKSSRRKRYLVKRRRILVAKIKRKLRRRRSRQRVLAIKKRKYQFTPRSPVHAGRTVAWKRRAGYRYNLRRKLEVTRLLFKRMLCAKRPTASTTAVPQHSEANTLGHSLLWALLQFVTEAKSSKQDLLVARLSGTIRRSIRRNFIPAAPLMRLLLLKAFTLATTTADLTKKLQLIVLERRWLSATTARITPLLIRTINKTCVKKRITTGANLKSNKYPHPQPVAPRYRSAAVAKLRSTAKVLHLKRIYRTGVKRLLPRHKLIIRLRLLKPKRWHTKKTRTRLKRRRITAKLNWRRLRQYRQARLFVTHHAQGRLQGQLRDGERHRARLYSFADRKARRGAFFSTRPALKRGLKTRQRHSAPRTALREIPLRQRRSPEDRLDSLRLRAHKALLWKAPLRPRPAASQLDPAFTRVTHWHADSITLHPAFAPTQRQELRRSVLTSGVIHTAPLALAHFGQRWHAIRICRRALLPTFTAVKRSNRRPPVKKIQSRGRLSWIGRAALRPKPLNYRTKQPYFCRKKAKAKKAPVHRVRALRRISFRKNRFFVRRLSTAGYRIDLLGKLIPKRTLRPIVSRPLRTGMRRHKPLRRSLRCRLAKRSIRRYSQARVRKVRSSTGRILSKLKLRYRRFKRWMPKKNRKAARKITKRVRTINTILEQLEHLATLRTRITASKHVLISKRNISARSRHLTAIWKGATPVRLLLRAPRRIARLRRLRHRITTPTSIQRLRYTTLQSKTLRSFITPLRRAPKKKLFRSLLPRLKKHKRQHGRLRRTLRLTRRSALCRTLRPTSRRTLLRALLRTLPELTPGKYRWLRRHYRKALRRAKRTPKLRIIRKGNSYKLRVAPNRPRLLVRVTSRHTNKVNSQKRKRLRRKLLISRASKINPQRRKHPRQKLPTRRIGKVNSQLRARSIQKLLARRNALPPSKKRGAKLELQLRKLTAARARSKVAANPKETRVPATATSGERTVPTRARPPRHVTKKTPATVPPVVVSAPLPPASVPALPTVTPTKKVVPHSRQIRVRFSTLQLDKKISQFNREPNIFTKKAYDALMSGVKSSWTALEAENSTLPKAQREFEATTMERLYNEVYGGELVRGNPKSIPDFKQYDANRKAAQSTGSNKN